LQENRNCRAGIATQRSRRRAQFSRESAHPGNESFRLAALVDVDQAGKTMMNVGCVLIGGLIMSIRITIRGAIIAVGILTSAGVMNSVTAAPLVPATASIASTDPAVATPVRWRGHGGGGLDWLRV